MITSTCSIVTDDNVSPGWTWSDPDAIARYVFKSMGGKDGRQGGRDTHTQGEAPRVQQIMKKVRTGIDEKKAVPKPGLPVRDGTEPYLINSTRTPHWYAEGENRDWGGAFAVYRGLTEALPYHRLFNTRFRKGNCSSAVGYGCAVAGLSRN